MRATLLITCAALALSACGGSETANTDANMMATDNMMMTDNATMTDPSMNMDANMMAADPATQNAMMNDMNTNAPDTNLSNGM